MAILFRSPIKLLRNKDLNGLVEKSLSNAGMITVNGNNFFLPENLPESLKKLLTSNLARIDCKTVQGQIDAFVRCAPVAAIIGRLAEYSMNGRWAFMDANGKEVTNPKTNLLAIMESPNLFQTWNDVISSAEAFKKLHGQSYLLPIVPAGFKGIKYATALHVLPNWMVQPIYTGKWFFQSDLKEVITGYRVAGFQNIIPADEMIVVRDTIPQINNLSNSLFEGQSRLYSLSDQVNNCIAIQDALYNLTINRGALGAWVNDNARDANGQQPFTPADQEEVYKEFGRHGITSDKVSPYKVIRQSVKWIQAAMAVGDLKLFEGNESAIVEIAMAYSFPMYLLGLKDSTFTNLNEAGKAVYSNAVIPSVENTAQTITRAFLQGTGIKLQVFFDHLEVFQKSKGDEATALKTFVEALHILFLDKNVTKEEVRTLVSEFMPVDSAFDPENINGTTYSDGTGNTPKVTVG
jgi:hypothetical protein